MEKLLGSPSTILQKLVHFFKGLCTPHTLHNILSQVPFVLKMVKDRLQEGFAVVIGLQSTGEAALDASDLAMGQSTSLISTTRVMLTQFLHNHFPTTSIPTEEDKTSKSPVPPS